MCSLNLWSGPVVRSLPNGRARWFTCVVKLHFFLKYTCVYIHSNVLRTTQNEQNTAKLLVLLQILIYINPNPKKEIELFRINLWSN